MGTRGAIARPADRSEGAFEGRYHHWDSYPEGLGRALFRARRVAFGGDTDAMLKVLLDDHTGWSTIVSANWSDTPGFIEGGFTTTGPQCYCHGGRSEEGWLIDEANASGSGVEYVYVLDGPVMHVLSSYSGDRKMIGMFGMGDPDATWKGIARIDLDGDEPDWEAIS